MSTLRVDTIENRAGTGQPAIDGLAKAWVNFNGTGTVAIRASFNVTSITDNGTGDYTVNFTTAMSDADFGVAFGGYEYTSSGVLSQTTSTVRFNTLRPNDAGYTDRTIVQVAIFR